MTYSPSFTATGITGARLLSRYAGATPGGAPVYGTFEVGDFVIDRSGAIWVCTAAGIPGTWASGGSGGGLPLTGGTLTGSLAVGGALGTTPVTLTDAAAITVNAALSDFFRVTLGGNRTLGTPSNPTDGQSITVEVIQPGSGGPYTLSYSGAYTFTASAPQPSLSTAAGDHDFISFTYSGSESAWVCTGYVIQQFGPLVTVAQGGTGQTTATLGFGALSPMTTLGDIIYENSTPAGARLAGNTSATKNFLIQTGTGSASAAPAWGTIAAGDLPGSYLATPSQYAPASQALLSVSSGAMAVFGQSTTIASGSNGGEISTIASWSAPSGGVLDVATTTPLAASGTVLVAASGSTTAVVTYAGVSGGNQLTGCAYVSGSATGTVATGGLVAQSGAASLISTGSFAAPASGSVVVTANFTAEISAGSNLIFGVAAHGTVTPMVATEFNVNDSAGGVPRAYNLVFLVTGLTPGTSYNLDLLGAASTGTFATILAYGTTATSPSLGTKGSAVTMLVQAV